MIRTHSQLGKPQCLLTLVVFVVSELLAAVAATAGRGVLQVVVLIQGGARRKAPIAHAAAEWPVACGHSYFLSSPVASPATWRWLITSARLFNASSRQPP